MKITTVPYEEKYEDVWNEFVYNHPLGWFWHTSYRLKNALGNTFKYYSENHSFLMFENKRVLAIVPLTLHKNKENGKWLAHYSESGIPCPLTDPGLSEKRKERVLRKVFRYVDEWAIEKNVSMIEFTLHVTCKIASIHPISNPFTKYGYIDSSFHTHTLPLKEDELVLFNNIGTNHKRSIKEADGKIIVKIYDNTNITKETFIRFNEFYFKTAGKITRPQLVFDLVYGYIRNGYAILTEALYKDQTVGVVVSLLYKKESYYLMGASDRGFKACPIAHYMHWEIIRYLLRNRFVSYEIGFQDYGPTIFKVPSVKERNISKFKRGFGGICITHYRGEKYYSKEYFDQVYSRRIKEYKDAYFRDV